MQTYLEKFLQGIFFFLLLKIYNLVFHISIFPLQPLFSSFQNHELTLKYSNFIQLSYQTYHAII